MSNLPSSEQTVGGVPKPSSRSRLILLVSALLAAVLLYLSVRKVQWHDVWLTIVGCRMSLLAASIAIGAGSYFVRGLRWRVLLNTQEQLPILPVFWANSAGYLGNNVLPARAGELIRTAMVSSQSKLNNAFVLTTALAERMMDAIVLMLAGTVVLHVVPHKPDWLASLSRPLLIVSVIAAASVIAVPLFEDAGLALLQKVPLSKGLKHRLSEVVTHIASGVRSFHDPSSFTQFLLLTILIWGLDGFACTVLAQAMSLQVSFLLALLLIVGLAMGSALPSTPGYIGIFQFVAVTILVPFGISRAQAIAFILLVQASALVTTGLLGSVGLLQYRKLKIQAATASGRR